jgi:hypothetical protein
VVVLGGGKAGVEPPSRSRDDPRPLVRGWSKICGEFFPDKLPPGPCRRAAYFLSGEEGIFSILERMYNILPPEILLLFSPLPGGGGKKGEVN